MEQKFDAIDNDVKASIELITKWLRQSGLKVNNSKTEIWFPSTNMLYIYIIYISQKQLAMTGFLFFKTKILMQGINLQTLRIPPGSKLEITWSKTGLQS